MYTTFVFRTVGGFASIIFGLFLGGGHLVNLFFGESNGNTFGYSFIFLGHLGLSFAFIGLYEIQGKKNGLLGVLGMLFSIIGTIFVTAIVFVEIAGASGINIKPILNEGITGIIYSVGPLFFVLGMIFVGISVMKEGILPRMGGLSLIVGTFVFALATLIPSAEGILTVVGGGITSVGFVWLGSNLLSSNKKSVTNIQAKH